MSRESHRLTHVQVVYEGGTVLRACVAWGVRARMRLARTRFFGVPAAWRPGLHAFRFLLDVLESEVPQKPNGVLGASGRRSRSEEGEGKRKCRPVLRKRLAPRVLSESRSLVILSRPMHADVQKGVL